MCKHLLFVLELGQNITDIDYINICLYKKKGLCILKGLISIYLVKKKKTYPLFTESRTNQVTAYLDNSKHPFV